MRLIFGLVLLVGLGLAGFAVHMAQGLIQQNQQERDLLLQAQANATKLVDVVVVTRKLAYGERFAAADLEVIKVQEGKVPEGAFAAVTETAAEAAVPETDKNAVFLDTENRPRAALRSYEPFEPLLAAKITEPGIDAGISANISPGMRAFSINVDVSTGVAGFLRPGDLVDVYWSGNLGGLETTKLIDTGVRLVAINQSADADRTEETIIATTVTIEGSPERVAALSLAQQTGRLTLSLIGQGDETQIGQVEIDQNKLLGVVQQEVVPVVEEEKCFVYTNKGTERVPTEVPCTN